MGFGHFHLFWSLRVQIKCARVRYVHESGTRTANSCQERESMIVYKYHVPVVATVDIGSASTRIIAEGVAEGVVAVQGLSISTRSITLTGMCLLHFYSKEKNTSKYLFLKFYLLFSCSFEKITCRGITGSFNKSGFCRYLPLFVIV